MPQKWREWLEEEIVYVISDRERELFLQLTAEEQRERFAKVFWEVRDPTPGTERNEVREEHQRRLEYANKFLGRETMRPGWRTDRGRMYIILGKPREVQSFPGGGSTYPLELWFYQADPQKGVPPFFYLIFFKRYGFGEYALYSPFNDGPQALATTARTPQEAHEILYRQNPELASASISYLLDEGGYDLERSGLGSTMLMAEIENIKNRGVNAEYVERILLGQEAVITNYTFNSTVLANVLLPLVDERGGSMIHFAFELLPEQVSLGQYDDEIYGALEIDVRLAEPEGITIYSDTKQLDFTFTQREFESARTRPVQYEGHFACVAGRYNLSIQVKNKVSKEYHLVTGVVEVPETPVREAGVGVLLLTSSFKQLTQAESVALRPFQFSSVKIQANPPGRFSLDKPLLIFCQLYLPPERRFESPGEIGLRYILLDGAGEEAFSLERQIPKSRFPDSGVQNLFSQIPMNGLAPGRYTLRLEVDFGSTGRTSSRTAELELTGTHVEPPTIFSGERLVPQAGESKYSLGRMWEALGDMQRAEELYLAALNSNPRLKDCRLALSELLLRTGQYDKALRALEPMVVEEPNNPSMLRINGLAYFNLGEFSKAAKFLERLLIREGDSTEILNLIGEAYSHIGNREKARKAWRRSLELDGAQPGIRGKLEELP